MSEDRDFHSSLLRTTNFKETIYRILKPYDGAKLNLLISGGSLLTLFGFDKTGSLKTEKWKIYFSDERCNPNALNYSDAEPYLRRWKAKVFPIDTSLGMDKAATEYQKVLEREVSGNDKIDLCLLGVGDNGHICSLWPDSDSLKSKEKVVGAITDAPISPERVTITVNFINSSVKSLYFVIPPKNGVNKKVTGPHNSISELLTIPYSVILPMYKK